MITHLLGTYGYLALFVGTVLEGETILILAGFAAHRGYLSLPWVIVTAFLGSLTGDQVYFHLARRYGRRLLEKRPSWRGRIAKINELLARYSTWFVLGFRFLYGLRTVSPLAIGLTSMSSWRFLLLNACGAAIWATLFGAAGYLFGTAIKAAVGRAERYEALVFALIAAVGVVVWLIRRRRSRAEPPA